MDNDLAFVAFFWKALNGQFNLLPFFILQMVAVMAVFLFTLMALRGAKIQSVSNKVLFGVVFGITGYLLTALVADFIGGTLKPYIRNELLFVASLVGGWPAGLISGVLTYIARVQFGGSNLLLISALESASFIAAGAFLYPWATRRDLLSITAKAVLLIGGVYALVALTGPVLFHWVWPQDISQKTWMTIWVNRIPRFP